MLFLYALFTTHKIYGVPIAKLSSCWQTAVLKYQMTSKLSRLVPEPAAAPAHSCLGNQSVVCGTYSKHMKFEQVRKWYW